MNSRARRPTFFRTARTRGVTLVELLVVVGIVAGLALVVFGGFTRSGGAAALRSGQATIANAVAVARTRAMSTGRTTRLLLNVDANSGVEPSGFLQQWVVQVQDPEGWATVTEFRLPGDVYVVPGNFALPAGLLAASGGAWTRTDGSPLRSTALRSSMLVTEAVAGDGRLEQWVAVTFSPVGATAQSGDVVLALGRKRAPGSFAAGESPVELVEVAQVRGLAVSTYGVAALIEGRASF